jgi:hypothetical protein
MAPPLIASTFGSVDQTTCCSGVFRRIDRGQRLPGFIRTGFPRIGHQECAVCAGKCGLERFRAVEIRQHDFVAQLRMPGRIARQRAHLELTARL